MKKLGKGFALAAAGGMLAAPAMAVPGPNTNSASYWEGYFTAEGFENVDCTKSGLGVGSQSVYVGAHDVVLVKGGAVDYGLGPGIKKWPEVGYGFPGGYVSAPDNAGGNQAAISWLMWCDWDGDVTS